MKRADRFLRNAAKLVMMSMVFGMVSACKNDDDDNTVEPKSITDVVQENSDFTILRAAMNHAVLAGDLESGTLTVFAPGNAAFAASGYADSAAINALPADSVKKLLQYHVLNTTMETGDIATGNAQATSTLNGQTLYISKNANGVFVNGIKVSTPDIDASNGVIHIIDRVLEPPTENLLQIAQGNPDFSYLVAAATRASEGDSGVLAALTSTTAAYTVLAPTNQAFIDAGFPTEASLAAANADTLAGIILYHVVPGRVFGSDLVNGNVATAAGDSVQVDVSDGLKVTGLGNGTDAANIPATTANTLATNGVIHVIDRVLLPK